MITLTIPTEYAHIARRGLRRRIADWIVRRFVRLKITFPNITLERGESLIMHSEAGIEKSVAVRCEADGRLRVFFDPPRVDREYIDVVEEGLLVFSPDWKGGS